MRFRFKNINDDDWGHLKFIDKWAYIWTEIFKIQSRENPKGIYYAEKSNWRFIKSISWRKET